VLWSGLLVSPSFGEQLTRQILKSQYTRSSQKATFELWRTVTSDGRTRVLVAIEIAALGLGYRSNMKYSLDRDYVSGVVNRCAKGGSMIKIRIDRLVKEHGRTFYWLSKTAGISHTTLWRLKKDRALGINFITLERLCEALNCQPGDLLSFSNQKKPSSKKSLRTHPRGRSASK